MKKIVVGIKGPTGILKAESEGLADEDIDRQLAEIVKALEQRSADSTIKLSWLSVRASDVLYARTYSLPT